MSASQELNQARKPINAAKYYDTWLGQVLSDREIRASAVHVVATLVLDFKVWRGGIVRTDCARLRARSWLHRTHC